MSCMEGPLSTDQNEELVSQKPCVVSGAYVLTEDKCRLYLENLGKWSLQTFDSLESNMKQVLVSSVAQLFVDAAAGITNLVCEHGNSNAQGEPLPPVLSHELPSIHMRQQANTL